MFLSYVNAVVGNVIYDPKKKKAMVCECCGNGG